MLSLSFWGLCLCVCICVCVSQQVAHISTVRSCLQEHRCLPLPHQSLTAYKSSGRREALSLHDRKLMGLQINHSCYEFNYATAMSSSTWKTIRQHSSPSSCPHVLPASSSMLPLSFGDGDTDVPFVVTLTSHFLFSLVPSLCITFATKRRTLSGWRVSSEVESIVALIEDSGSVPWKYRAAHNCLQFLFQALLWPVQALHACDTQNTCGQSRYTH